MCVRRRKKRLTSREDCAEADVAENCLVASSMVLLAFLERSSAVEEAFERAEAVASSTFWVPPATRLQG